jgi:hypothetical protein
MLKTGVYRRDQLSLARLGTFFGRRRFIAVTLYPEVAAEAGPEREALLGQILRRFPGAAGTYKRTQRHRFEAFDADLAALVADRRPGDRPYAIHDLAVSDGGTALDFLERLDAIDGLDLHYVASDLAPDVTAIRADSARLTAVVDPETQRPLQLVWPPFVFNVTKPESAMLYPINRLLLGLLLRTAVPSLRRRSRDGDATVIGTRIRLLAPDVLDRLDRDPRFTFERHDVLEPLDGPLDLVRAMNILNPSYFDDRQLRLAVGHVHAALRPGGLFATGSNQDAGSTVDGGVYERTATGFRLLTTSGLGSPVDRIIAGSGGGSGGPEGAPEWSPAEG